jgi:glycolate oxidase FAD binding subunit
MTDPIKPRDAAEVQSAIQWAVAGDHTLEIVGRGSKRGIGRAAQWDRTLDLSGLSGVTLYEPAELVLSARAATPMAEIEALLEANSQALAFEPMDYGPLLGGKSGDGTLGGALAANLSGPRRIKAGAARDHFLGFRAVSGRGETFKSGGRVVKNVTGYDLSKLMAGSWGTLAVMTDVTVKVLPRPETEATLVVHGLIDKAAAQVMSAAMGSAGEVSAAAHLPAGVASRLGFGHAMTVLRLEGVPPSIAHRRALLETLLKAFGDMSALDGAASRTLWRAIRDVLPFAASAANPDPPVWRISTAPLNGPDVAAYIARQAEAEFFFDWAGGLIWVQLPPTGDGGAALVRSAVAAHGGHATLIRAAGAVRASAAVFQPLDPVTATISKRIKESYDPKGVLNPGRMYPGV